MFTNIYSLANRFVPFDPSFFLVLCRTLRNLRLIRLIYSVKKLKNMLETIISTLPATKPILLPVGYVIFFFSVTGLYLFNGAMDIRCRLTEEPF